MIETWIDDKSRHNSLWRLQKGSKRLWGMDMEVLVMLGKEISMFQLICSGSFLFILRRRGADWQFSENCPLRLAYIQSFQLIKSSK